MPTTETPQFIMLKNIRDLKKNIERLNSKSSQGKLSKDDVDAIKNLGVRLEELKKQNEENIVREFHLTRYNKEDTLEHIIRKLQESATDWNPNSRSNSIGSEASMDSPEPSSQEGINPKNGEHNRDDTQQLSNTTLSPSPQIIENEENQLIATHPHIEDTQNSTLGSEGSNRETEILIQRFDNALQALNTANCDIKDPRIDMLYNELGRLKDNIDSLNEIKQCIENAKAEFESEPGIWSVLQPIMNTFRWIMGAVASLLPVSCFEVKEDCDFYCVSERPSDDRSYIQNPNRPAYVLYAGYNNEPETIYYLAAGATTFKALTYSVDEATRNSFPEAANQPLITHGKSHLVLNTLAGPTQQAYVDSLQTPLETTSSAVLRTSGLLGFFSENQPRAEGEIDEIPEYAAPPNDQTP